MSTVLRDQIQSIQAVKNRLGMASRGHVTRAPEPHALRLPAAAFRQCLQLQRAGLTFTEIAEETGCTRADVVHDLYTMRVAS